MSEIGDEFLKNAEYAAVDRVQLKGESLARKAVLMNGCIWEGPDGVLGPCLIRKERGVARIMPETGAAQAVEAPHFREAGAPKLGAAAARRDFAADPLGPWVNSWSAYTVSNGTFSLRVEKLAMALSKIAIWLPCTPRITHASIRKARGNSARYIHVRSSGHKTPPLTGSVQPAGFLRSCRRLDP